MQKNKYKPSKTYNDLLELRREIVALKAGRKYQKLIIVNPCPNPCTNVTINTAFELIQHKIVENETPAGPSQHDEEAVVPALVNALRFLTNEELEKLKKEDVTQVPKKRGRPRKIM
jgi:hypothetical protein